MIRYVSVDRFHTIEILDELRRAQDMRLLTYLASVATIAIVAIMAFVPTLNPYKVAWLVYPCGGIVLFVLISIHRELSSSILTFRNKLTHVERLWKRTVKVDDEKVGFEVFTFMDEWIKNNCSQVDIAQEDNPMFGYRAVYMTFADNNDDDFIMAKMKFS